MIRGFWHQDVGVNTIGAEHDLFRLGAFPVTDGELDSHVSVQPLPRDLSAQELAVLAHINKCTRCPRCGLEYSRNIMLRATDGASLCQNCVPVEHTNIVPNRLATQFHELLLIWKRDLEQSRSLKEEYDTVQMQKKIKAIR